MEPVFVADVGNSAVKAGLIRGLYVREAARFPYRPGHAAAAARALQWLKARRAREIGVGSVNGKAERTLFRALKKGGISARRIGIPAKLPLNIEYDRRALGLDRLADSLAARALYRAKNLLIFDVGTALTVNVVEGNVFRGGWIAPGLPALFAALYRSTDRIPRLNPSGKSFRLGRETRTAVSAGCRIFFEGGLKGLVAQAEKLRRKKFTLIVTGGGSAVFKNLGVPHRRNPGLTLLGYALMLRPNKVSR